MFIHNEKYLLEFQMEGRGFYIRKMMEGGKRKIG